MILDLLPGNSPTLRLLSTPVSPSDICTPKFQQFASDLIDTLKHRDGIGLAAPQVGILQRVIVVISHRTPIVMINPYITKTRDEIVFEDEMCLSFPGIKVNTTRYRLVTVEFIDLQGTTRKLKLTGLEAVCVQHEVDHLNGVVIGDF